ncbi:receptor-type tyrosine-protein phosphatase N2 [Nothoprocta perdicaria]|uniref:receptor-type tyrosine-protein phosphatase N2 n=1 Tax=Nothoprocta perdicaria TaxID=30464 RepID=UPI000E1C1D6F|nr:receptor-type tyrosine-protein phosphatase N2 [Nothoprocta perdicaria]
MSQKPKESAPALAHTSTSHQQQAENLPGKTLKQPLPDKLLPESEMELDQNALIATLHTYIMQNLSAQSNAKSPPSRTKGAQVYAGRLYPSQVSHSDGTFTKAKADFEMKSLLQPRPPPGTLGPSSEILNQNKPKDPLSTVDETLIKDVLKNLEKHQVHVENLSSLELDEIADTIADAIQGVDIQEEREEDAGKSREDETGREKKKGDAQGRAEVQTGIMKNNVNIADNEVHEATAKTDKEEKTAKLVNFLNENALPENMPKELIPEESTKTETKKSEDTDSPSSSSEEINAGVENVKSETFSRELTAAKNTDSDSKELSETRYWMQTALMKDENPYEELQKKTGHDLQLEVKSFKENDYGYIVTAKDPLNVEKGLELIKEVADLLKLQMSAFDDVNILGPAVTFRVHSNLQNISSADVAKAAAINKEKLEKTTGLKILETGMGEELCRQRMAVKTSERPEPLHASRLNSVSSQFSDGPVASPSARSSTSSWCEEPVQSNMDISTGHMILSYMEDHLKNKNRLEKEWEALCAYQAEPNATVVAQREENTQKNRSQAVVPYDHSRICLKAENSHDSSDYINASPIMDHDPRNPAYIATQGPLPATGADFWQMVWENGCVVIVMLTPLTENGIKQCYHYWPDEGSNLYHIYEVNLVSEHIWCEDFLVRSFYLKNLQTNETRTVTQFHFLSWNDQKVPASTRSLLDFRRKVNKCYRGRSCPVVVHCSDGAGRSGTYILIDMVLNKMAKGAKEIDIAATLEHLRDQRPGMVQTKEQFEFALTAVAEEVNAILKALPQ